MPSTLSTSSSTSSSSSSSSIWTICGMAAVVSVSSFIAGYTMRSWTSQSSSKSKLTTTTTTSTAKPAATTTTAEAEAKLWKLAEGALCVAMLHAADQLNLFEILHHSKTAGGGPISCAQLATSQNWNERYLREVLLHLCGVGICRYNASSSNNNNNNGGNQPVNGTFELRKEYIPLLLDPDTSSKSLIGLFPFVMALMKRSTSVVQAVQTGIGVDYDVNGSDINDAINRKNKNFFRNSLIDDVLPSIVLPTKSTTKSSTTTSKTLVERLQSGINVADIGCGYGASTIAMAKAYPQSMFYAFESSESALEAISQAVEEFGLTNVVVCDVAHRTVDDGPNKKNANATTTYSEDYFDFVYAHDVLHDMTHPRNLIHDVKRRLEPQQGCWLIVDVTCMDSIEDNIQQPKAGMLYAFSCLLCLSSSTSTPDGEGLGTCGFPPKLAQRWMIDAGFQYFQPIEIAALPYNNCYLVCP